ncbi:MAG: dienelactone hydrolase family protein [Gammaproteobacteria bacterium]|nr:dienelactone hydrolase family protein [Gammaproteobacteria bacterium]MDH4316739.1 dienelactone hydrolase family protein [Gammaproteobacteria bacterium]
MSWQDRGSILGSLAVASVATLLIACDTKSPDANGVDAARQNVDAMSREHADDVATPSPAADMAPLRAIVSETLPYAEVDEELVRGYFVFPADMVDPLPAIIVIHEWWGLNDGIRAMADRLAGEGYIVLAVDLYGGKVAEQVDESRKLMLQVVENPESANENLRQAYSWLKNTAGAPRIGSLGWCFGGGWSLNTALLFPDELDAAVIYYGQVTDDRDRLEPLNVPILGLFGANDRGITVESVNAFSAAMDNLGKNYEIEIYPNAGHAFANPTGNNYDPAVAELAWQRTINFLKFHLSIASDS